MTNEVTQDMRLDEYWSPEHFGEAKPVYLNSTLELDGKTYWIGMADDAKVVRSVSDMVAEFTKGNKTGSDLWIDLIWEEAQELFEAYDQYKHGVGMGYLESRTALLKEMTDLIYVVHGLANELNWDLDEAIKRVHASNMSKLDDNGEPIYNEAGKRMKGPNYKAPDLKDLV